jgi:alginate O-acetyltransferase complex protein AlgI
LSRALTLLFVMLAWTVFRAHGFDAALTMYAGQAGLQGIDFGAAMRTLLRPSHGLALVLGLACVLGPAVQPWFERRLPASAFSLAGQWPLVGFLLAYALIASRGAVPFLYFQF